jgi:hypothetical protein
MDHWRKTARVCPKCHKLKSSKSFIDGVEGCSDCEINHVLFGLYKKCVYCCSFKLKEEFKKNACDACVKRARDNHQLYEGTRKLGKLKRFMCSSCKVLKSGFSYSRDKREGDLVCKSCISKKELEEAGRFRCKHCGGTFPKEEYRSKKCLRCYEKNKIACKLRLRQRRIEDPSYKIWEKECCRHYYYNVFKIIYNKVLLLQLIYGHARERKVNRNGYWYVLNRSLFKLSKKSTKNWINMYLEAVKNTPLQNKHPVTKAYVADLHPDHLQEGERMRNIRNGAFPLTQRNDWIRDNQ